MLPNCPATYYLNCKNALKKCKECRAAKPMLDPQRPLHYSPIDFSLRCHPASEVDGEKPTTAQREGRKARNDGHRFEKRICHRLSGSPTCASGQVFGDGDMELTVNGTQLNLDVKLRTAKSFSLSLADFKEGRRKGIDGWVFGVREKPADHPEMAVLLPMSVFEALLTHKEHKDG